MIQKRVRMILSSKHDFLEDEIYVSDDKTAAELAKDIDYQFTTCNGQAILESQNSVYILYRDKIARLAIHPVNT